MRLIYIIILIIILLIVYRLRKRKNNNENSINKLFNEIYKGNANLKKIRYIHSVPEVVFIVWFGNNISENRLKALNSLINNLKVPYIIITEDNYKSFELNDYPFHRAFEYLSGNHKSDYLRAYLLNHYGGGYHDIKYRDKDWINQWDIFSDSNIWIKSRRERHPGHIGYDIDNPKSKFLQTKYNELGTMCWVICRPNTLYTKVLLSKIHKKLDYHYNTLKKYPSKKQEGYYSNKPFTKVKSKNVYPLRWLEIMGEIFHPLMYKYKKHMNLELPDALKKSYK